MSPDDASPADLNRVSDEAALYFFRIHYPDSGVCRFRSGRTVTWTGLRGDERFSASSPQELRQMMRDCVSPDVRLAASAIMARRAGA